MTEALTITKIDPRVVHNLGVDVAKGMTIKQACLAHEPPIPVEAFNNWIENDTRLKFIFERAQAIYVKECLEHIETGEAREIKGTQWILEKAHAQFGRKGETIGTQVNINGLTIEQIDKIRASARRNAVAPAIDIKEVK